MNKSLLALAGIPLLALGLGTNPAAAGEIRVHVLLGIPHVIHAPPIVVHRPVVYHAPMYYPPHVIYHPVRPPHHHGGHRGHGHHGKQPHAAFAYRKGGADPGHGRRHG